MKKILFYNQQRLILHKAATDIVWKFFFAPNFLGAKREFEFSTSKTTFDRFPKIYNFFLKLKIYKHERKKYFI